jgi:hypothetical protein
MVRDPQEPLVLIHLTFCSGGIGKCLARMRRNDLQDFVDRLRAEGLDASTIRNMLMPVRTIT